MEKPEPTHTTTVLSLVASGNYAHDI